MNDEARRRFYEQREPQAIRARGQWIIAPGLRDAYVDALAETIQLRDLVRLDLIEWMIEDPWDFERLHNSAIEKLDRAQWTQPSK